MKIKFDENISTRSLETLAEYAPPLKGDDMKTFVGIDLGSTTTKAVFLDDDDGLICVPRLHPEEVL